MIFNNVGIFVFGNEKKIVIGFDERMLLYEEIGKLYFECLNWLWVIMEGF